MRAASAITCAVILFATLMMRATWAAPAPSKTINYQGYLKDSNGIPVSGTVTVYLSLYDSASGQTPLWAEKREVLISNGLYQINLGEVAGLYLSFDQQYWLGIRINGDDEMQPRQKLNIAPYAFRSEVANTVPDKSLTAAKIGQVCADGEVLRYDSLISGWRCSQATTGTVVRWRGPFDPLGEPYQSSDLVQYNGSSWIAVTSIPKQCEIYNVGGGCSRFGLAWATPGVDGAWQLFASGSVGAQGPQGVPGPTGPQGPVGPQGPATLPSAFEWRQDYSGYQPAIPFCWANGIYCSSRLSVAHITLPDGNFAVTYVIGVRNGNNYALQNNSRLISCYPSPGGVSTDFNIPGSIPGPELRSVSSTFISKGPGRVDVYCIASDPAPPEGTPSGVTVVKSRMVAVQVGAFTVQVDP